MVGKSDAPSVCKYNSASCLHITLPGSLQQCQDHLVQCPKSRFPGTVSLRTLRPILLKPKCGSHCLLVIFYARSWIVSPRDHEFKYSASGCASFWRYFGFISNIWAYGSMNMINITWETKSSDDFNLLFVQAGHQGMLIDTFSAMTSRSYLG